MLYPTNPTSRSVSWSYHVDPLDNLIWTPLDPPTNISDAITRIGERLFKINAALLAQFPPPLPIGLACTPPEF